MRWFFAILIVLTIAAGLAVGLDETAPVNGYAYALFWLFVAGICGLWHAAYFKTNEHRQRGMRTSSCLLGISMGGFLVWTAVPGIFADHCTAGWGTLLNRSALIHFMRYLENNGFCTEVAIVQIVLGVLLCVFCLKLIYQQLTR